MKQVRAALALSLAACTSWRVDSRPAAVTLSDAKGQVVRLSLKSGQRYELSNVTVQGDSVTGLTWAVTPKRVTIATSEVTTVEFQGVQGSGTVVAIGVMALGVVLIAALQSCQSA